MHVTDGRKSNFTLNVYIFRPIWKKELNTEGLLEILLDDCEFCENP
jgi:hypothetical protein